MPDDDVDESRAERLRSRRSSRQSEPSKSSEPSERSKLSESDPEDDQGSVKDELTGTYMYLHESQKKEIDRLYNVLKAEYEYEYDEEFEKNRHFYPLLVQYGLESLDGLGAEEIRLQVEQL